MPACPYCASPTNTDCYRLLLRCVSPECGRYSIRPDPPVREIPLFDWPSRDRLKNET